MSSACNTTADCRAPACADDASDRRRDRRRRWRRRSDTDNCPTSRTRTGRTRMPTTSVTRARRRHRPGMSCSPAPSGCPSPHRLSSRPARRRRKEQLKVLWKKFGTATTAASFGDPWAGRSARRLSTTIPMHWSGASSSTASGMLCGDKTCWKAKGTKGWGWRQAPDVDGIAKIGFVGGDVGRHRQRAEPRREGPDDTADGRLAAHRPDLYSAARDQRRLLRRRR